MWASCEDKCKKNRAKINESPRRITCEDKLIVWKKNTEKNHDKINEPSGKMTCEYKWII